ncbi:MAG: C4-dicarboxylate ABC transporter permease [Alphaproteobacteria bacterium]|nr:C4-dicarboxylate ABC transporter permease [Alphaproteobacteria bacterium]
MFDPTTVFIVLGLLLILVFSGMHVAIALGVTSAVGVYLVTGRDTVVLALIQNTFYDAIRDYIFAVIPLFMLMGEFIGRSGATTDLYIGMQRTFRRIPGRLALATLFGNAIFAFVTGVSIASATTFTRIAYPEMTRYGYNKSFSLGVIAGSGVLGMLIPPSVLMIVWGILTEQSIGQLFLAGVLPGLILVSFFATYIIGSAIAFPSLVGDGARRQAHLAGSDVTPGARLEMDDGPEVSSSSMAISGFGLLFLIVAVLGGIWAGLFTPTEAAGIGALIALALAIIKGQRWPDIYEGILAVGRTAAPLLILLIAAQLYSRTMTMTGVVTAIQGFFNDAGLDPWMVITFMVLVWFVLGMIIDSVSIMLLTVPIFAPIADAMGMHPLSYALIGILAIEAGILTPPFGLLVYTVKAAIPDKTDPVTMLQIFKGSTPYWVLLLVLIILLYNFPEIVTFLPDVVFR